MACRNLICPNCGTGGLSVRPLFYDALVSAEIEAYKFFCKMCEFSFEVKSEASRRIHPEPWPSSD